MSTRFCHVHNHTEYSLLDGANRIPDLIKRTGDLGMESLAITDHGVMFGVMEFYMEAKKQGIKPILGVEAYVAPQGIAKRGGRADNEYFHLLLLAKDLEGYRNLCKLSTIAALEGYYYKPRIDHEILRAHAKGLIGTSACLGSEISQFILDNNYERAQYTAGMYAEIFGEGNFFIELQDHRGPDRDSLAAQADAGVDEQRQVNASLVRIAQQLNLPLVATNDAHYLCRGDDVPHDVLLCIGTGSSVTDQKRMRFDSKEYYLKSPDQMADLFPDHPEAIENTLRIAEMCNVELDKQRAPMPKPDVPENLTSNEYLAQLAEEGLARRSKHSDEALSRLHYELGVIKGTGFEDYFLLVREFANATRERGIYFGVRGSAAGSLVSYAVGITDVDPIEYDLTFERFLNPERVSMPDIDMDFEDARRDEIIQYVTDRFGKEHVAQIVTFGTLGAKAAIKDCGRVMGYSPAETDKLTKTIPALPGFTLKRAYDEVAEFRQMVDADANTKRLYETAQSVEGIARHPGVHAAGVVISREPLVDYVPLYRGTDGQAITAYEMGILEKIGLLKMDFLGLSNLTVLARCVENIRKTPGHEQFDIQTIPESDPKTFEMLGKGDTIGVFQLEGGGMTRYVQQLKPSSIRELAAMIALYRPGPMEHIPRFIDAKMGRRAPEYVDERMRPLLEETYGVIVYQDQVLKLVQALAGFSLGKADILRRAMGKKDQQAMAEMKSEFLTGTAEHGIDAKAANSIWELLLPFAGYAFNKAHAVCYSILAYQTAYLKANFATPYMAALLSVYLSKEDRVTTCIEECRRMKIGVLPPDVNQSGIDFAVEGDSIRFGLAAIKGVGEGIVQAIVEDRTEHGPFTHLYEFCERLKPAGVNRTAVEALIRAGALDGIDRNRRRSLEYCEAALQFADSQNRARQVGQDSLFGDGADAGEAFLTSFPELPNMDPPTRTELLAMEKEVIGIYVSDHPLRGHERLLAKHASHSCSGVSELDEGVQVRIAGIIAGMRQMITKSKGERMATLTLEDFTGQVTAIVFPKSFEKLREVLVKDTVVQLVGYVTHRQLRDERSVELRVESVRPLDTGLDLGYTGGAGAAGSVRITIWKATESQLRNLRKVLESYPGDHSVMVQIMPDTEHAPVYLTQLVSPSEGFLKDLRSNFARCDVEVLGGAFGMAPGAFIS